MGNIFILSQPIQTGKTSLLLNWIKKTPNVGGILTPDVDGNRMLYDIVANQYHMLQTYNANNSIKVGRFVFDAETFIKAQQILLQQHNNSFTIVDEVGPLELTHKTGLEPALSVVIDNFKQNKVQGNLLLIIRDYLLQEAIDYYQLYDAQTINTTFFNQPYVLANTIEIELTGLVLCGGQSVRMGSDKAFLTYHKKPQYLHVADMLSLVCNQVFISCNQQQNAWLSNDYKYILDNTTFGNSGPIGGLLTAFEELTNAAIFVVGCDYPYFTKNDMMALVASRNSNFLTTSYLNLESGFTEPLLAIYEKQCAEKLFSYFNNGETSLRHFIQTVSSKSIFTASKNITSIDSPIN